MKAITRGNSSGVGLSDLGVLTELDGASLAYYVSPTEEMRPASLYDSSGACKQSYLRKCTNKETLSSHS